MWRCYLVAAVVAVILAACTTGGGPPTSAVAEAETEESFVGTWRLVSWTSTPEQGETVYPYGEDAFGRLFYHRNGKMAAILMRQDRPSLSSDQVLDLTQDEYAAMAQGFFAYSGDYLVDTENKTVTHRVEASQNPNWVGGDRVRQFEWIGADRIVLRALAGSDRYEVVWQREH